MKRKIIDELMKWKTEDNGKHILLTGLKGVGKTYLAYDFAKAFFEYISYINLERESETAKLFDKNSPIDFKERLVYYLRLEPEAPVCSRILILDEIGSCPDAINMLKDCDLSDIFRYIILISSSPIERVYLDNIIHIPVYPLEFDEFLIATGNEWYIEAISNHFNTDTKMPEIVHKELLELHKLYLRIGGMPSVINEYLNISSLINIPEMHSLLTSIYRDNINIYHQDSEALKMLQVYDCITNQLIKDNKKFQYKLIRKGTTHSMYKDAIQKLCDFNYVVRCGRMNSEQLQNPIKTLNSDEWNDIETNTTFKLYYPDTGILYSKIQENYGVSFNKSQSMAILENYVAASLVTKNYKFAFWESESMSKIDFIYQKNNNVIPIEIFSSDNTRSKNISVLKQKCSFPYAVKISSRNFELTNQIKYVPYYAVFCL